MFRNFTILLRKELRSSFLQFSSYLIAAIVLFINGILFQAKVLGKKVVMSEVALNDFFYLSSGVVLIAGVLYASRMLADEVVHKTDYLLSFSGSSTRSIVYSKFATGGFFLFFLLVLSTYIPAIIYMKGQVSLLHILVGYTGLFLFGCISVAVTLAYSAISSRQWLVAILAASTLGIWILLWMLAGVVENPLKGILAFLALHDTHFKNFQKGVVQMSSVFYYLSIMVISLEIAIFHWDGRRWKI